MTLFITSVLRIRQKITSKLHNCSLNKINCIQTNCHNLNSVAKWYRNLWIPKSVEPPFNHITQVGDPVLRRSADEVPLDVITSPEIKFLIDRMKYALKKYNLVGMAAPQIGISLRIIAMEFRESKKQEFKPEIYKARNMQTLPMTIFINPVLKITDFEKKVFVEACASVCGYSADVPRYNGVQLNGFDENGNPKELNLVGWNARIAQHELDHLNGVIYTDVMDRKTFSCTCWQAVNAREGRVNITFYPK